MRLTFRLVLEGLDEVWRIGSADKLTEEGSEDAFVSTYGPFQKKRSQFHLCWNPDRSCTKNRD